MTIREFEYWREAVIVLLMLSVLILDAVLFDSLWPLGEEGVMASSATLGVN